MNKYKLTTTSTRDLRQLNVVNKWITEFNCIGGIIASTGFGKTVGIAMRAIQIIESFDIIFVVPTLKLQEDTKQLFKQFNPKVNVKVLVINTASNNNNKYECDLLIVDEAQRSVAETFVNIFNTIEYKKLLWLTALIERSDGRHNLLLEKAPIVDTISLQECVDNKWTESIDIYTVPIELTKSERKKYNYLDTKFEEIKLELGEGNPMDNARKFLMYLNKNLWLISKKNNKPYFKNEIKKWFEIDYNLSKEKNLIKKRIITQHRNSLSKYNYSLTLNSYYEFINKNFTIPSKENVTFKKALLAKELFQIIRKRKELLYNAKNRLTKTLELIEKHKDQYKFVIGQTIDFLEKVKNKLLEETTGIYHSKLKKKEKDYFFNRFKDGRTKMKTLISAKSLVEGVDIPKLEIAIVSSYTSSKSDAVQLRGRLSRIYKDKKPILYYLYCVDTIEKTSWLNNITKNIKTKKL